MAPSGPSMKGSVRLLWSLSGPNGPLYEGLSQALWSLSGPKWPTILRAQSGPGTQRVLVIILQPHKIYFIVRAMYRCRLALAN